MSTLFWMGVGAAVLALAWGLRRVGALAHEMDTLTAKDDGDLLAGESAGDGVAR